MGDDYAVEACLERSAADRQFKSHRIKNVGRETAVALRASGEPEYGALTPELNGWSNAS